MKNYSVYESPLAGRYAGKQMSFIWSAQKKHSTWRRLWLALAEAEKELGLNISDVQINEMRSHLDDVDFERAELLEKELRHDVMSHIHAFGEQCPNAMSIIHLGATSCYVTDNTELIQIKEALELVKAKLLKLIALFASLSEKYADLPVLGFTHFQPAQLTTLGKRFSLYLQDLYFDFQRVEFELEHLPFRGVKGTTGTQASFLALFDGNHEKVMKLDTLVSQKMGFSSSISVSGQTYTRKVDYYIISLLSGIAQSCYKFAGDIRLLSHLREVEEPFETKQIGSSAMAYKRNPMRCERICSLARYIMSLPANAANTHSNQWFERTLDDSANRRIILGEAFLGLDVILSIVFNVASGLQIWPKVISSRIERELPFMATENIIMAAVKLGGDRQAVHESIRKHSMEAIKKVKEEGLENDLISRIKSDPLFSKIKNIDSIMNPADFIGRAPQQVTEFIANEIRPLLNRYQSLLNGSNSFEQLDI